MTIKESVKRDYALNLLWCTECLKYLTPDITWIPDDINDGRRLCYDCAPDDAIRVKDLS